MYLAKDQAFSLKSYHRQRPSMEIDGQFRYRLGHFTTRATLWGRWGYQIHS